jgi:hypothetical protein
MKWLIFLQKERGKANWTLTDLKFKYDSPQNLKSSEYNKKPD